jgi:hypothetical protein
MSFYVGLSFLSNDQSVARESCGEVESFRRDPEKRGLLSAALSAEARRILGLLSDREVKEVSLIRETGGRPYFTDRYGDFSISHSRRIAAVSLICGGGYRTGCDIEYMNPRRDFQGISRRFFHPVEQDYIAAAGDGGEMCRRFYAFWVLKESFLKLRGLPVAEIAGTPVFSLNVPALMLQDTASVFFLGDLGGSGGERYMAAAALETWPAGERSGPFPQPAFRWFSEETLPLNSIAEIKAELSPAKTVRPKT